MDVPITTMTMRRPNGDDAASYVRSAAGDACLSSREWLATERVTDVVIHACGHNSSQKMIMPSARALIFHRLSSKDGDQVPSGAARHAPGIEKTTYDIRAPLPAVRRCAGSVSLRSRRGNSLLKRILRTIHVDVRLVFLLEPTVIVESRRLGPRSSVGRRSMTVLQANDGWLGGLGGDARGG